MRQGNTKSGLWKEKKKQEEEDGNFLDYLSDS